VTGQTVRLTTPRARWTAHQLIDRAPDDAVVNIRKATRTTAQNDLMWAQLSEIARAKPDDRDMTSEQWKAVFMDACGHKPTFVENLEGDGFVCLGYKSSRLSKEEFSDLIECINDFGARKGVWKDKAA
jgi:hypothetical protein